MTTAELTRDVTLFLALLGIVAQVSVAVAVVVAVGARRSPRLSEMKSTLLDLVGPAALQMALAVAVIATAGSLYFSEVANFVPCRLCWYQRIAMYPLAVVLAVATIWRDAGVKKYVLPVVTIGAGIAAYHYQLERFPDQATVCSTDVPCTTVWVWEFHYISIPFMALSAFLLIATCLLVAARGRTA